MARLLAGVRVRTRGKRLDAGEGCRDRGWGDAVEGKGVTTTEVQYGHACGRYLFEGNQKLRRHHNLSAGARALIGCNRAWKHFEVTTSLFATVIAADMSGYHGLSCSWSAIDVNTCQQAFPSFEVLLLLLTTAELSTQTGDKA